MLSGLLKLDPPECYHLVGMPGQTNSADEVKQFRTLKYGRAAAEQSPAKNMVTYIHTPLAYVASETITENSVPIPAGIKRLVFKNVVETAVQVSGHEGVWHEGVFMVLAEGV